MSFNHTVSGILRGHWLIDKSFASASMPLVFRLLDGESVSFHQEKMYEGDSDEDKLQKIAKQFNVPGAAGANVYSVRPFTDLSTLQNGSIAVVSIAGPLMKSGGICSYGMVDQAQLLTRLKNAENISGVLLDMDTPGGQAYGTSILADAVTDLKSKKPVITVVNDGMIASAGVWVGTASDEVYATKTTDKFGSIGVYTTIADWNAQYKDLYKLPVTDVYAPQSTDKNRSYMDALAGNDADLKEDLSVLADQFINTVASNRSGKIKGDTWKTGKMFYAKEATSIGLIDGIKTYSQVVQRMNKLIADRSSSSKNSTINMANKNKNGAAAEGAATEENVTAFSKTLRAAGAESFAVTDDGFALSEENLNGIEAALQTAEENAEALDQVDTLTATVAASEATIASQSTTIENQAARITALEAEVKELGAGASGENGTVLTTAGDTPPGGTAKVRSYNDPNSAINKKADRRLGLRK